MRIHSFFCLPEVFSRNLGPLESNRFPPPTFWMAVLHLPRHLAYLSCTLFFKQTLWSTVSFLLDSTTQYPGSFLPDEAPSDPDLFLRWLPSSSCLCFKDRFPDSSLFLRVWHGTSLLSADCDSSLFLSGPPYPQIDSSSRWHFFFASIRYFLPILNAIFRWVSSFTPLFPSFISLISSCSSRRMRTTCF